MAKSVVASLRTSTGVASIAACLPGAFGTGMSATAVRGAGVDGPSLSS
jgi:hypothetical protein